jgi:acyl-ACP thioesterase
MFYSHRITENIRHHECNAAGNMKLNNLLDRLQNAAAEHAAMLNVGMDEMAELQLIWVLSRLKLHLLDPLPLGKILEVTTFPTGIQRIFAHRCYDLRIGGERVGYAGSFWLPVNAAANRPVNVKKVLPPEIIDLPDVEKFFPDMDKLDTAPGEICRSYKIGAGDIDLNRHLNNAVYARWISDSLGERLGTFDFAVEELQINFLSAGQFGEEIFLRAAAEKNGSFSVSGEKADGTAAFQAQGKLFA